MRSIAPGGNAGHAEWEAAGTVVCEDLDHRIEWRSAHVGEMLAEEQRELHPLQGISWII